MKREPLIWTADWAYGGDVCAICGEPMKIGQRFWLTSTLDERPWHAEHRQPDGSVSSEPIT